MMEILATIWQVVQMLLLLAVVTGSILILIAVIHPLRFDLKLRGTVKGQRAEVWFVYLFRLLKIGVIATPHTQDVIISFMGWKKRIERMGKQKQAVKPPSPPPAESFTPQTGIKPESEFAESEHMTQEQVQAADDQAVSANQEQPPEPKVSEEGITPTPDRVEPAAASRHETAEKAVPTTEDSPADAATDTKAPQQEAETIEPEPVEPETTATQPPSTEVDSQPLKPLHEVEEEYKAAKEAGAGEQEAKQKKTSTDTSLKQLLRKFKRDASRRFNQFKGYARLARFKWRTLSPVLKRFWQRGKKAFSLPRIDLLLRYALHEPYLTGMCHGTLAVVSGMAGQWGINFVPVPNFGTPMLYSRAYATGTIKPWRLLFATAALLFEKQLYKEAWQLFKWYRAKKQH